MGMRISYELIKDGKRLTDIITQYYDPLRELIDNWHEEALAIGSNSVCSEQVIDFMILNDELPSLETIEQEVLDTLVYHLDDLILIENYKPKPFKSIGSSVHPSRYKSATDLIRKQADEQTNQLWNYLLVGRSLKDDAPFTDFGSCYKIGFWKREECRFLYQSLIATFGTVQQIRDQYWTDQEKQQYQDAVLEAKNTNSYISLTDHNPISSGIEYVLEMLEEVYDLEVDVIFGIG